jgi:hypothetical protein
MLSAWSDWKLKVFSLAAYMGVQFVLLPKGFAARKEGRVFVVPEEGSKGHWVFLVNGKPECGGQHTPNLKKAAIAWLQGVTDSPPLTLPLEVRGLAMSLIHACPNTDDERNDRLEESPGDAACRVMNILLAADPAATNALVDLRVPVNDFVVDRLPFMVDYRNDAGDFPNLGIIGVINGILASIDPQSRRLASLVEGDNDTSLSEFCLVEGRDKAS